MTPELAPTARLHSTQVVGDLTANLAESDSISLAPKVNSLTASESVASDTAFDLMNKMPAGQPAGLALQSVRSDVKKVVLRRRRHLGGEDGGQKTQHPTR